MATAMLIIMILVGIYFGSSVAFSSRLHSIKHTDMSWAQPRIQHYSQSKTSLSSASSSTHGHVSSPFHDMDEVPESFAFSYASDDFSLESWEDDTVQPQPPPPPPLPVTTTTTTTATISFTTATTPTPVTMPHHTPTTTRSQNKPRLYKHLFRHYDDISFDSWLRCSDPQAFLESIGYTPSEIQTLATSLEINFWKLDVHDQLAPKIRFVVETLGGGMGRLAWKPDEGPPSHSTTTTDQSMNTDMDECSLATDDTETEMHHTLRLYPQVKYMLPPNFFHPSLSVDRTLGPNHAYLAQSDLPHGRLLLDNPKLWQAFLTACQTNTFESLCHQWETYFFPADQPLHHTPERIQNFATAFASGLIPACKSHKLSNNIVDHHSTGLDLTSSSSLLPNDHENGGGDHHDGLIPLLLSHGANAFETDRQGASPLHWAAGNGNLPAVQALLQAISMERYPTLYPHPPTTPPPLQYLQQQQQQQLVNEQQKRDDDDDANKGFDHAPPSPMVLEILDEFREYKHGATPFHWACASVRSDYQNAGFEGSYNVCQYLLQQAGERHVELANLPTTTRGSHPTTPIMWAAWAGNLPVMELLLVHGADPLQMNPATNQTAMHFASASGHAEICDLLLRSTKEIYRVEDQQILDKLLWNAVDIFGKTPLDYARDSGHANVIEWMMDKSVGTFFLVKETAKGWFVPGSDEMTSSSSSSSSSSSFHKNKNSPKNPKWSA